MKIHKEGFRILTILGLVLLMINLVVYSMLFSFFIFFLVVSVVIFLLILQFFRHPKRVIPVEDPSLVYAPADGKIVVIEEVEEKEFFQDRRLQVSIFMSPLNVHVNRNPISGKVTYRQYHPGQYLVAWHPKSSEENERFTVVLDNGRSAVLIRQIAGAVARRIRNYLTVGQQVDQGSEMGFIKFGSRVDLLLPPDTEVTVKIGQQVRGNVDVVGRLSGR